MALSARGAVGVTRQAPCGARRTRVRVGARPLGGPARASNSSAAGQQDEQSFGPACDVFTGAKAAECWANAEQLTRGVRDSVTHARAEAELAFRGQAETWRAEFERQEAERQAQAAADAAEATLFGEPFPWLGSWSDKLYWALRTFGLSAQGVRHKAGKRTGGGKDIWWNEDGSLDFVDSDDIARS